MGKKRTRAKQVSKGLTHQRPCKWSKLARRDWMTSSKRQDAQLQAFIKFKNVIITIPNPNKNETNKKFIKVNAREVWGNPKGR